jgi:2-oxo-4-hydroxy-4-carboxy-5-ureidoimidazoline decarboxylase
VVAFNALGADDATARLLVCLNAPSWAAAIVNGRPYPDRESLLATAYRLGVVLDSADLDSALSRHPRIGERPAGDSQEASHSRSEQGSVDGSDDELARALRAGNLAYEERFGQVFLIRAAGRSGPQILEAMATRLMNDPQTEAGIVRDQLAQIAQLRIDSLLAELAALAELAEVAASAEVAEPETAGEGH